MNKVLLLAGALSLAVMSAAGAQTVAITNGTIHTMGPAGSIEGGTVVFRDGVIRAVGVGVSVPADATVIDAQGAAVTPGLMNSYTRLGLLEVSQEPSTDDMHTDSALFSAAFDVSYGLNPESVTIPVTRVKGVTRAVAAPASGKTVFAGRGAVIAMGEGAAFWIQPRAAMFVSMGEEGAALAGGARGAAWVFLRRALDDAIYYRENTRAFERNQARAGIVPPVDLEALVPVTDRTIPMVIAAHRASDIRQVIQLAADYALRVILLGGREAWKVADELAKAGIPVIADPRDNLPSRFESLGASLENVPKLVAAGVKVAFATTGDSLDHNPRNLTQFAGIAAGNGLPWDDALAAMTRNPAEIWGIADSYGTLEAGKDADVVIWSGDPLELATVPTHVFIRGAAVDLDANRPAKLRDRYREPQGTEPPLGYR